MTTITEETPAQTTAEKPKASKKASVGQKRAHVAPAKGKSATKAKATKKAPKTALKTARPEKVGKEKGVREGSKTETILGLMKRSGGTTLKEIMEATGWQSHSVRGFISGTLGKKMGLTVTSTKAEDGERTYSIKT